MVRGETDVEVCQNLAPASHQEGVHTRIVLQKFSWFLL